MKLEKNYEFEIISDIEKKLKQKKIEKINSKKHNFPPKTNNKCFFINQTNYVNHTKNAIYYC